MRMTTETHRSPVRAAELGDLVVGMALDVRTIRAETRGIGVRTAIVMPGLIRTNMIAGFAKARATRVVGPDRVGAAIVDALSAGRQEVFVPSARTDYGNRLANTVNGIRA